MILFAQFFSKLVSFFKCFLLNFDQKFLDFAQKFWNSAENHPVLLKKIADFCNFSAVPSKQIFKQSLIKFNSTSLFHSNFHDSLENNTFSHGLSMDAKRMFPLTFIFDNKFYCSFH